MVSFFDVTNRLFNCLPFKSFCLERYMSEFLPIVRPKLSKGPYVHTIELKMIFFLQMNRRSFCFERNVFSTLTKPHIYGEITREIRSQQLLAKNINKLRPYDHFSRRIIICPGKYLLVKEKTLNECKQTNKFFCKENKIK